MLYALLKAVHLLALVVWVGGMFFTLWVLRPALAAFEPPLRLRLMSEILDRFLRIVGIAVVLIVVSGAWMLWSAMRVSVGAGLSFNMPLDWLAMITLGVVMILIYGYIRHALFVRLQLAQHAQDAATAAVALSRIRTWVAVNLGLGVTVVCVMRLALAV